jgi:AcrR family transcriptional regulator
MCEDEESVGIDNNVDPVYYDGNVYLPGTMTRMTPNRPYHHGNLKQALLDRAAVVLRERGAAALSLRELARDIGVSHAAPGRHFPDRQALLDALAADGFSRLGGQLHEAVAAESRFEDQVRSLAGAYVDFATADANLLELLFAHKHAGCDDTVGQRAADAFAPTLEMFRRGQATGMVPAGDPMRIGLIFLATLQGIAALVNGSVVPAEQLHELTGDAVAYFLRASRTTV